MPALSLKSILSNVTEFTNDAVIITDAPQNGSNHRILFVNPTFSLMTGYHSSEAVGRSPSFLQGEGSSEAVRNDIRQALAAARPIVTEILNYKSDGTPFWAELSIVPITDETGSAKFFLSVQRETTQQRNQRRDLAIRSIAMDATSDAVAVCQLDEGTPWAVYGNRPFAKLFANSPHQTNFNLLDLISESRRPETIEILRRSAVFKVPQTIEEQIHRRHGPPLNARIFIEPVPAELLGNDGLLVRIRDITEENRRKAEAVAAQQLRAIGQLTGGVAHDFNNLLTIVTHCAEILLDDETVVGDTRELIQTISDTADVGASLTSQLLSFARKRPLEVKHIKLRPFLERFHLVLKRIVPSNIEIELDFRSDGSSLRVDPAQLESALLNLCINARDAMETGGVLTLVAESQYVDNALHTDGDLAHGNYVSLSVADTGAGMSEETRRLAFEPFYTTKDVGRGSGLGLSMVYGFAQQSGGSATISSALGLGTKVTILLPEAADAITFDQIDLLDEAPQAFEDAIVLVVEDDPSVRKYADQLVRGLGCRTYIAANAVEALDVLGRINDINVLFTDLVMPGGVSGAQLAKEAIILRPGLRVLFTSGYATEDPLVINALASGAALISKPYRRRDLGKAIASILPQH